jgi:hypothetical protein
MKQLTKDEILLLYVNKVQRLKSYINTPSVQMNREDSFEIFQIERETNELNVIEMVMGFKQTTQRCNECQEIYELGLDEEAFQC